jgi:hypothetical protein
MAGRAQKLVSRREETVIDYDKFIRECERAARAENGPTLPELIGRGRKVTLEGKIQGETVAAEVVLDAKCIEVSITLKPVLVSILGRENMNMMQELMDNPDGPIENVVLWRTNILPGLDVEAFRTGNVPPFMTIRAKTYMQLRSIFEWLYGVPIYFEIPRRKSKRARDTA